MNAAHRKRIPLWILSLLMVPINAVAATPDFELEVAPILINHCLKCHHQGKSSGGLNLAVLEGAKRGGESGPVISTDPPGTSLLLVRIEAGEMPPPNQHDRPLTKDEIKTIRDWIAAGARWPKSRELGLHEQSIRIDEARDFWSFQPVQRPPVPQIAGANSTTHPIDAFIDQKRSEHHVDVGQKATSRQLLRRASLDLIGLPPTLIEQDQFLNDTNPHAYEQLIDRLLATQGYGERWARHWLDLVRYADSNGYERDGPKPSVWRYRDYVIESLNRDKPYDRFVLEQLAGDELSDRSRETVIATGFHALGAWQDEVDPLEAAQYRADELDDMLRTTSQTFLGITIGCARCHHHKFDPFSMVDYYSLAAILSPLKRPNVGREDRDIPVASRADLVAIPLRDQQIAERNRMLTELRALTEIEWLKAEKSQLPVEAVAAYRTPAANRNPQQVQLIQKHHDAWQAEIMAAMPAERQQQVAEITEKIQQLRRETPDLPRGYFQFEETPSPPATFLLLSGRASNRGPEMRPAVPVVLSATQPQFTPLETGTSGRRIALAQWMVDPANPLTARVIVNRVWQHHFGQGIVATPSDFGHIGARPTHPELLDWLADWFVHDAKWSLKKLHRLIMTSQTYQMSTRSTPQQRESDPNNHWLGRFPYRRLDVEAIRDSILATSGKLNPEMFGPAVYLPIPASVVEAHTDKEASWKSSTEPAIYRRTIYAYVKRTLLVPLLEVLDLCDTTNSTEKRSITSIAPQALTLYNGDFVNSQAIFFADRLLQEVGTEPLQQIDRGYRIALCRPPTETEQQTLLEYLQSELSSQNTANTAEAQRAALIQVCRVILNLNEFVYVE